MNRQSNTLTIIRKEFARFFGDRQLLLTTVLLPGLLIYMVYTFMGMGMTKMQEEGADEVVTLVVENMPPSLAPMLSNLEGEGIATVQQMLTDSLIGAISDKEVNMIALRFPPMFDDEVAVYRPQEDIPAPNVQLYHNSNNNASARAYATVQSLLDSYEASLSNRFDINRADTPDECFDLMDRDEALGNILSKLVPMLIMMMLFSGVMSIAPSSIAGEKERGTIATLLVTPMRRNELAFGKIVSLGGISLLSGISSFVGIALSLPRMIDRQAVASADLGLNYTMADYAVLLLVIFASVLVLSACVSVLSALARDTKNAGTMVMPLMLVVMMAGLIPMFQEGASTAVATYLVPFYNSIEVMVAIFDHSLNWLNALVCLGANVAYTGLAVWGLTRLFDSERVMFGR